MKAIFNRPARRRERIKQRVRDTLSKKIPMSLSDLDTWVHAHYMTLNPADNSPSIQFATTLCTHHGCIPRFLYDLIDPDTIVTGEEDDRIYVRFQYKDQGFVVKLYAYDLTPVDLHRILKASDGTGDPAPFGRRFDRQAYDDFIARQMNDIH